MNLSGHNGDKQFVPVQESTLTFCDKEEIWKALLLSVEKETSYFSSELHEFSEYFHDKTAIYAGYYFLL